MYNCYMAKFTCRFASFVLSSKGFDIILLLTLSGFLVGAVTPGIENGDFETGDLSGWTVFATPNGSLGGSDFPRCEEFDTKGEGVPTKSLTVKVGQREYQAGDKYLAGGGIWTNVGFHIGHVVLRADIASTYASSADRRNLAGGVFELLFDKRVLAQHDIGPIENGATKRFTLKGESFVSEGMHEIRVQIRRPFRSVPPDNAPQQFVDNISLSFRPF